MAQRVAVITGAGGGIGSAAVERFQLSGWTVVAVDRDPISRPGVMALRADLANVAELDGLIAHMGPLVSRVDALVNNAAEQLCKPLRETTVAEWDRIMATNVRAAYYLATGLYPLLRQGPGSIVNVASIHALATSKGMAAYAASKGALVALTRAMAVEFAEEGVRANAVIPGAVDTPMLAAGLQRGHLAGGEPSGRQALQTLAGRHPLGRVAEPAEIARAIEFLADAECSSFVTGHALIVDGGAYARLSTE